jgi:hypothetical protein
MVPRKLQFGNLEHIKLRDQIAYREQILEDGIDCWRCEGKIVFVRREGRILFWRCDCGETLATDRDGDSRFVC